MVRRLILMRHAKSSWDHPGLDDHARPLNRRGRRSAKAMGDWLRARGHLPDAAISSDSTRTRETFAGLGLDCPVTFTERLYHADAAALLAELRKAEAATVLMIAHNPGIGDLAAQIVGTPPDHPRFFDYPTGATLVAEFRDGWASAGVGSGAARDFMVPRDLSID